MSFIVRQLFIAFLSLFISFFYFIYQTLPKNRLKQYHSNYYNSNYISNTSKIEEYDYIIIGAGPAGCILANRLSTNHNISVLLIEAGGADDNLYMYIPSMYPKLYDLESSWQFFSNNKNRTRKISIPQGKSLGGSSVLSRTIYQRGLKQDYDNWNNLGFPSWDFEHFLHYFERIEGFIGKEKSPFGSTGEFKFSNLNSTHNLTDTIKNSIKEVLNMTATSDNLEDEHERINEPYLSVIRGEKFNVATAYLTGQILKRKNLWIKSNTLVRRILFNDEKRAYGVEVGNTEKSKTIIKCRKEVILTAGAIGSPKLMLLSGIGDEDTLNKLNISVVYNNGEVGRNLNDHPTINIIKTLRKSVQNLHINENFPYNLVNTFKWIINKNNNLCSNHAETIGYLSTDNGKIDLQITIYPNLFEVSQSRATSEQGYSISLSLLNQTSRGIISLKSNSFKDKPNIELNFLKNQKDVDKLLEGLKRLEIGLNHPKLKEITESSVFPRKDYFSEENIREDLVNNVVSNYNLMSSCSMGKVVDENLKVVGVQGLRIADSSVIPVPIRGYILSTVMVVAERCSDLIIKTNN